MAVEGPRALKEEELRSAIELSGAVFGTGGGPPTDDDYGVLLCKDNLQNLRVFADGGRAVSLVGMLQRDICLLGSRHRSCAIGSVCTAADYRGQGLATRLLRDARDKAVGDGADIFLISGGRGLYRRLGYVDVGGYHVCTVKRGRLPKNTRHFVRPWQPEDVPALVRIHSAEPVRFVRAPKDFLDFLHGGHVGHLKGATQIVCAGRNPQPVAYISYQIGGSPWERRDKDAITVAEVAGPRWAIVQALGGLLDQRGVGSLDFHYLDCDAEIAEMARSFGWPTRPRSFHGTVGVINPARFWQACRPLFAERLGEERADRLQLSVGESIRIAHGGEQVSLEGMSGITELIFLPTHRRGELDLGLGADSELRRLLDQVFPLPLVDYGLNYA